MKKLFIEELIESLKSNRIAPLKTPANTMKLKVEAITVCINYADFLKEVLSNKMHFDKWIIVTDLQDTATQNLCAKHNIECIATDIFYRDCPAGTRLPNKALGINEGLKKLSLDGWVLQLDADIWLPPHTRQILEGLFHSGTLDSKKIYGIDRFMCNTYQQWEKFLYEETRPIHDKWYLINMDHFPIGHRLVNYGSEGYLPIGFFQLWNPAGAGVRAYPELISGYDRTDVLHAKQFNRLQRSFLPELMCIHLQSETGTLGQNWNGRRSKPFKAVCAPVCDDNEYRHVKGGPTTM